MTAAVSSFEGLTIREMMLDDYDEVAALWQNTPGIYFGEADSRESLQKYWARNPGLSLVARDGEQLVGAVIGGHDGRRGTLHHLAIAATHQRRVITPPVGASRWLAPGEAAPRPYSHRFFTQALKTTLEGTTAWLTRKN